MLLRTLLNQAANLGWMLQQGYSVSLYMFHGGTSFGWMNGANSDGKNYEPDVTSYDYDSPLDESGRPTPKFFAFRDTIQKATGIQPPDVPSVPQPMSIAPFKMTASASLWQSLPKPIHAENPLSMEDLDQAYGYILYRTTVPNAISGEIVLDELHDYAQIYLNGHLVGTLDRRLAQNRTNISVTANAQLDILIENSGRVNFSHVLRGERKGITKQVTLAGMPLKNWDIYSLPMTDLKNLTWNSSSDCSGPCFYRTELNVPAAPADTFLDTSNFSKGQVWVNGEALGRVWNVGPQRALYLPAPWLKQGGNDVVVFDLNGAPNRYLQSLDKPRLSD